MPKTVILAALIAVYIGFSFTRVPTWQSDESLMRSVLEKYPEAATAHFIMGNALASQNKEDEAMTHFQKTLASRPEYPEVEFNLGVLEHRQGRILEAEKMYRSAIKHKPSFRPARMALVQLLDATGRRDEAKKIFMEDPVPRPR